MLSPRRGDVAEHQRHAPKHMKPTGLGGPKDEKTDGDGGQLARTGRLD
jgi:hypothetical protein